MAAKGPKNNENGKINENYVPSDYKHVQAVLDKKAEEMLEKLYGKDWYKTLNGELLMPEKKTIE